MEDNLQKFFYEFNVLQEKYGIRVLADHREHIDYDRDEEPYISGISSYLTLYDKNDKKLAFIDWENDLIREEY